MTGLHTFEGRLYNGDHVVRENYSQTHTNIKSVADFKATLRAGEYAWPGAYQMYFITSDGAALSFDSATKHASQVIWDIQNGCDGGWRVIGADINYENNDLYCEHSGQKIPPSYAD